LGTWNLFWLTLIDLPTLLRRLRVLTENITGNIPTETHYLREFLDARPKLRNRVQIGAVTVLLYQFLIFTLISTTINVFIACVLLFAPFTFTLINKVLVMVQHFSMAYHSTDFRENSRTFRFNRFLEFLYANMNYHAEHHIFPNTPYYNLPKVHDYLLESNSIEVPERGLIRATSIAFKAPVRRFDEISCLSCNRICPIKPQEAF
jgi:fatty acid desaturase